MKLELLKCEWGNDDFTISIAINNVQYTGCKGIYPDICVGDVDPSTIEYAAKDILTDIFEQANKDFSNEPT